MQSSYKSSSTAKRINSSNGFVKAAIQAYCYHHHLQIRPDDIWMAILTQFSAFVNAHAEELHDKFVEHEGKKKLILTYNAQSRHDFDFSIFAEDMGRVLEEEVKDPGLRDWLIPRFTTTTSNDVVVASIVMMATLQSYFSYESELMCGLPSVTLLGEKADYELILQPLDYLKQFGKAPTIFAELLKPIIKSFITTFDEPTSSGTKRFWIRIASKIDRGSSGTGTVNDYSGWITAFCYWNEKGVAEYLPRKFKLGEACQEYFNISSDGVPAGYAIVPVVVTDNRQRVETVMVAGSLAIDCKNGYRTARVNTLQPELGWIIFEETGLAENEELEVDESEDFYAWDEDPTHRSFAPDSD